MFVISRIASGVFLKPSGELLVKMFLSLKKDFSNKYYFSPFSGGTAIIRSISNKDRKIKSQGACNSTYGFIYL
jgi:hypothetical protein